MIGEFIINTMWLLLMVVISGLVYIRIAEHDIAAVHVPPPMNATPDTPVIKDNSGLFTQDYALPPKDVLATFNTVAMSWPRTSILAGSVDEGMMTFVTRSRIFGFPDYTTLLAAPDGQGSRVTIYARLRFGRSDFGVNSARVRGWLGAVQALQQAG